MATIITGVVSNGLIVPSTSLPEGAHVEIHVSADGTEAAGKVTRLTPTQMRKLPRTERRELLAAAAALAEDVYRDDKDLTGFDAFSEELDDDPE